MATLGVDGRVQHDLPDAGRCERRMRPNETATTGSHCIAVRSDSSLSTTAPITQVMSTPVSAAQRGAAADDNPDAQRDPVPPLIFTCSPYVARRRARK